jgi:hypothetical protein
MADKIELKDIIDYRKDIIIYQSIEKPHKSLIMHFTVSNMNISGIYHQLSFRVIDALGKIRHSSDHLGLAVQAYNKLYNEDNSR